MTMIYLQGLMGLLIITSESAAAEPGPEISHFQNSLPVLLEQAQRLSYFQLLSDGWWCECHKKMLLPSQKKSNGRLLDYLAFDISPLHLMFPLSALINLTLMFMSVAVVHKQRCMLLGLDASIAGAVAEILSSLTEVDKRRASPRVPVRKPAHLHRRWITGLLSSLTICKPGQISLIA